MKRRYYLHRENAPLKSDSVIYSVWIGESAREQKLLAQLKEWAFAKGATLMLWSEDVVYYIDYESQRVFPGNGLLDFGFVRADLTAADALAHAKADDWDMYEKTLSMPKAFFHQISASEPSRVDGSAGKIKNPRVLPERRKNLSESDTNFPPIIRFI
jgi:hypothetical protein